MDNRLKKLILVITMIFGVAGSLFSQTVPASGVVISSTDELPVIGAIVYEEGNTSNGVTTDADGRFSITVPDGTNIVVTCMGYADVVMAASANMTIVMSEDVQMLAETVVTGYSVQRKADLTGSISVVDMDDLLKQNENNPIKAMQGRVPGMTITADGSPSGSTTVRIRGIGTLNNNDPLYIIDGVPTKAGMHELNGNDIESIQILKDAASASIYGSRAANGVVIITTKKGSEGSVRVNLDASVAGSFYMNKMEVLNTEEYGRVMWQAYVNEGQDPNSNGLGYLYDWGYGADGLPVLNSITMKRYLDAANTTPSADTDWFDKTTRTGLVQNYNLSASAGTDRSSAYFSLGYYKNDGIIKTTDFERYSARINTEYKLIEDILTIGEHFTLNRTSEVQAPGGFLENVLQFNPSIPVYTVDGEFAGPEGGYPDRMNPVAVLERNKDNRYTYWRTFGDAYLNLTPFKGFSLKTVFGIDYSQKQQRIFTMPVTEGTVANSTNAVEAKQEHWMRWMWNIVASYNFEKGKHRGDVLAGMELNHDTSTWFSGKKEDFSVLDTDFMWPDAGTGDAQAFGSSESYALVSFFAKANYSYDDRYLFSVTVRHDGSSRFGKNNRYATFPSASFGWRISNESFLKSAKWIDDLKIRASWGQTGNQEISNIARYTIYVPNYGVTESGGQSYGTSYDITGSNGGSILPSGFKKNQIGNDDLRWETTTQTNIGLDFTLFGESVYGAFDYYWKDTKDILVQMAGIGVLGEGSSKWINAGAMKNNGFEFSLGYRGDTESGFVYDINANISSYRNEITALPATVAANGTFGGNGVKSVIGHPYGAQVGYVADGIFKSQEDIERHAVQEGAGLGRIRWADLNKDGFITEADQKWIYDPTPDFSYGINFYFEYRNFDLTLFFQGVQGVDIISDLKKETDLWSGLNIGFLNKGKRLLDAWSPSNPDSDIPAVARTDVNNEKRVSTYFVEDGSFLKLRNVQVGYNLPEKWASKIKMQRLRLYFSAQNVFTVTARNFTGVDPENPNFGYPIPLTLTFGVNLSF